MKIVYCAFLLLPLLAGCRQQSTQSESQVEPNPSDGKPSIKGQAGDAKFPLLEARRNFKTKLFPKTQIKVPPEQPPPNLFRTVRYESPVGMLSAYLSPKPNDGKRHPAIIWLFGGFSNGISATAWEEFPPDNDQSASAFRKAGIIMMYPSLRGGNDNPGNREGFLGEVDDVLAAAEFLAKQDYVDPKRIYLGGHSTGGTLALLAAACTDRFRAVFSFGPAENPAGYGAAILPFDITKESEIEVRAPVLWVHSIQTPVFVFEGTGRPGNVASLKSLADAARGAPLKTFAIQGGNHFSILAPVTGYVAGRIMRDDGPTVNLAFTEKELNGLFRK